MNKTFVYLTTISDLQVKLTQERLKSNGIPSAIKEYNQDVVFKAYGANSFIGQKLFVPEDKLDKARKILNIQDDSEESKKHLFSKNKKPIHKLIKTSIAGYLIFSFVVLLIVIVLVFTGR